LHGEDILKFQELIRRIPVTDHVFNYAVKVVSLSRPGRDDSPSWVNEYLSWGAGPRASQFLILGAKAKAAISGKYSPDSAEVKEVALPILRHRLVKTYKAEAEGISMDELIQKLLKEAEAVI
jgi:MoxR-like ATPase